MTEHQPQPYPKMLYRPGTTGNDITQIVNDPDEQAAAEKAGWSVAEKHFAKNPPKPAPAPVPDPMFDPPQVEAPAPPLGAGDTSSTSGGTTTKTKSTAKTKKARGKK